MSLIEALSRLREELPLARRSAPKVGTEVVTTAHTAELYYTHTLMEMSRS